MSSFELIADSLRTKLINKPITFDNVLELDRFHSSFIRMMNIQCFACHKPKVEFFIQTVRQLVMDFTLTTIMNRAFESEDSNESLAFLILLTLAARMPEYARKILRSKYFHRNLMSMRKQLCGKIVPGQCSDFKNVYIASVLEHALFIADKPSTLNVARSGIILHVLDHPALENICSGW